MNCLYCKNPAELVDNSVIYGKSIEGRKAWLCKPCWAYVGCHGRSDKPFGKMANAETREWRMKTHAIIDPIWQSGKMSRRKMYQVLSKSLGYEVHVGNADIEGCKSIIYAAQIML